MQNLPEYIRVALDNVARKEGLTEYSLKYEAGSRHGDNFLGIALAVKLHGKTLENGMLVPKTLNLFCKSAPETAERRKVFSTHKFFKREILMYTRVLPAMLEFQQEKGLTDDGIFQAYPKCYFTLADDQNEQYLLILEDLRAKGYEMRPKEQPINLKEARLLVTELGKLHGISVAMKDQRPEVFAEIKKLDDIVSGLLVNTLRATFQSSLDLALSVTKNPAYRKLVQNVRENYSQMMNECLAIDAAEPFGILNHGDCWNNNLLFHYENPGEIANAKTMMLVDWQCSRYCSPVLDLLYSLIGSTRKEFRDKYWTELLELYYASLSGMVTRFGSDPDKLFTYNNLTDQFKKFGKFGLIYGLLFTQFYCCSSDEIPDLDEFSTQVEGDKNIAIMSDMDDARKEIFSQVINDIISDLLDYGYIQL